MTTKIELRYQIDDGYVGGARPQYMTIHLDDVAGCETEEQVRNTCYELAEEHMRERTSVSVRNEEDVVEMWRRARDTSSERQS